MHVYVHIPFCNSICFYCDFCRCVSNQKEEYIQALEREVSSLSFSKIDTLYFGGGTPSSLSNEQLLCIGKMFQPYLNTDYEWTIECNPDSLSVDKIKGLKKLGVNRISLGVQTFNDALLKSIGRKHTVEDVNSCIHALKENGFSNISVDLIYGLPNQSLEDVKKDVQCFLSLDLPHLSIYSLQIEENSVFGQKRIEACDSDLEADMYEEICSLLNQNGYVHYEISSFCKEGMVSRHNLSYWSDQDFVGIGCGASGKENNVRYDHTRNIKEYISNPFYRDYVETSDSDKEFEAIMMSFRSIFGLDVVSFNKKYNVDFYKKYQNSIEKNKGYLNLDGKRVSVNEKGMELLNSILLDFMLD